jgi:DNA-binding transcriptional MocR family regulator
LPVLRKAIAKYLDPAIMAFLQPNSEILVTVGASEAIDIALAFLAQ